MNLALRLNSYCAYFELKHFLADYVLWHKLYFPTSALMRGGLFNSYFPIFWIKIEAFRSSRLDVFLRKGVLKICCIFSEHLFLGTPLGGCIWAFDFFIIFFWQTLHLLRWHALMIWWIDALMFWWCLEVIIWTLKHFNEIQTLEF